MRELLLAGRRRVHEVLVTERDTPGARPDDDELAELARDLRVPVRVVGRGRLASLARSEAPQGVVALAEPLRPVELGDLAEPGPGGAAPFLIALDGVTDPRNVGSIARTAEAVGAHGLIVPEHRSAAVTPAVEKAAAGALAHLPVARVTNLVRTLEALERAGVWSLGLDGTSPTPLTGHPLADGPVVLVVGAEGRGLTRLVRERCDALVALPMRGRVGSLNASVAAGVALYALLAARDAAAVGDDRPE